MHNKYGVVLTRVLEVNHTGGGGGHNKFPPLKEKGGGRADKVLRCLEVGGGGTKRFGPTIFPFCSPSSP